MKILGGDRTPLRSPALEAGKRGTVWHPYYSDHEPLRSPALEAGKSGVMKRKFGTESTMPLRSPALEAGKSLHPEPVDSCFGWPLRSPALEAGKSTGLSSGNSALMVAATEPGLGGREEDAATSPDGITWTGRYGARPWRPGRAPVELPNILSCKWPLRSPALEAGKSSRPLADR